MSVEKDGEYMNDEDVVVDVLISQFEGELGPLADEAEDVLREHMRWTVAQMPPIAVRAIVRCVTALVRMMEQQEEDGEEAGANGG